MKDINAAMTYVSVDEIAKELRKLDAPGIDPDEWARKFFTMFLVQDHGIINSNGHGFPLDPGYKNLPSSPQYDGEFEVDLRKEVREIVAIPEDPKHPGQYWLVKMRTSWFPFFRSRALFFNFREFPHDGALILFKKKNGQWKASRMLWVVE
jgi:hypothetical protein